MFGGYRIDFLYTIIRRTVYISDLPISFINNVPTETTLIKLMTGDLQPTKGQVKRNMHLKISRFTQHFEEKLDLSMTPLDFFKQKVMPEEPIERIRPLLGRYGCTGDQQNQVMNQLSAGQKARIVFAIIAHEKPHLLLLDEPTNPLDMESIDALAVSCCWLLFFVNRVVRGNLLDEPRLLLT